MGWWRSVIVLNRRQPSHRGDWWRLTVRIVDSSDITELLTGQRESERKEKSLDRGARKATQDGRVRASGRPKEKMRTQTVGTKLHIANLSRPPKLPSGTKDTHPPSPLAMSHTVGSNPELKDEDIPCSSQEITAHGPQSGGNTRSLSDPAPIGTFCFPIATA